MCLHVQAVTKTEGNLERERCTERRWGKRVSAQPVGVRLCGERVSPPTIHQHFNAVTRTTPAVPRSTVEPTVLVRRLVRTRPTSDPLAGMTRGDASGMEWGQETITRRLNEAHVVAYPSAQSMLRAAIPGSVGYGA